MEHEIIFDNIKDKITSVLANAQNQIWVAVAWITDSDYLDILCNKVELGVDVRLVLMQDEFNRANFKRYSFLTEGVNLFFKDSHHKYCIVDDDVLITGSFNWTNRASLRNTGENILITSCKDSIANTKQNFLSIATNRIIKIKSITDFCIQKVLALGYNEEVKEEEIKWWFSLNKDWKLLFISEVYEEIYEEEELRDYYDTLSIEEVNNKFYNYIKNTSDIDKVEKYALNEFIILALNICQFGYYSFRSLDPKLGFKPLQQLRYLTYISNININSINDLIELKSYNKNLVIEIINIEEPIKLLKHDFSFLNGTTEFTFKIDKLNAEIISSLPYTIEELSITSSCRELLRINLNWFSEHSELKTLTLHGFNVDLYVRNRNEDILQRIDTINFKNCIICNAPNDFSEELYSNINLHYTCYIEDLFGSKSISRMNAKLEKVQNEVIKEYKETTDFIYKDEKGNYYKYVGFNRFIDKHGKEYDFFKTGSLYDLEGNYVNEDGSITPF